VERPALQGHETLGDEGLPAVDETGDLGPVADGPIRHAGEIRLVVLAEVGGVGVRDRTLLPHPGDRDRGVETTRERDADSLADRQVDQDVAHQ
jgi:hypothetical protein